MISQAVANSPLFWLAIIGGLAALWVLPLIIGLVRHVESLGLVVILMMFTVSWPAALVLACAMPRKEPVMYYSYRYYEPYPYSGPSGYPAGAGQHYRREVR